MSAGLAAANGNIYLRARFYDPVAGRFLTKDTYEGELSDSQSLNLYAYCSNNPVMYVDPSGHDPGLIANPNGKYTIYNQTPGVSGNQDKCGNVSQFVSTLKEIKKEQDKAMLMGGLAIGIGYLSFELDALPIGGKVTVKSRGSKIDNLSKDITEWVGKDGRLIKNGSGDTVLISKDGTRRVRFDINNPSPHNNPHGHVEELVNGKWQKSGPLYPVDVPKN